MDYHDDYMEEFLWWMRERQKIYIKRFVENEDPPWSENEIFQNYHFCNVHRELDYGTMYALDNILLDEYDNEDVLLNTIIYRFFNRPETFDRLGGFTTAEEFDAEVAVETLDLYSKENPLFSSAYRVTTQEWADADTKHENILVGIIQDDLIANLEEYTARILGADSLEQAFKLTKTIDGVGDFLAYEVVTDLNYRQLPFSENDFVNVGPGAAQGLYQIFESTEPSKIHWLQENQESLWDEFGTDFPYLREPKFSFQKFTLTCRDFEHSLCEANKFWGIKERDEDRRRFEPRDYQQDSLADFV